MWILSTLLFFAGGMTIYITVCLFENAALFGGAGVFEDTAREPAPGSDPDAVKASLNS